MASLSPMMEQYLKIKEQHMDQLLFYRVGDFYEMFYEDAKTASKELELVLTGKDCGQDERAPMCGVPHHACEVYISKLLKKGYKVAVCEQMEDPKLTKTLVKRDVIRVYTPGTLIEPNMLDENKNNYISSIYVGDKDIAITFADISTGVAYSTSIKKSNSSNLKSELLRFSPSEIIANNNLYKINDIENFINNNLKCCIQIIEDSSYEVESYLKDLINKQFNTTDYPKEIICSLGILISYLYDTQKNGVERLIRHKVYDSNQYMKLDSSALKNLEIIQTMRGNERRGSLLWALDRTNTSMGRRLLRQYIEQPLCNPIEIDRRLNAVEEIKNNTILRLDLIDLLKNIHDLERLLTRIVFGSTTPREVRSLFSTLEKIPSIKELISNCNCNELKEINEKIDILSDVKDMISERIVEDPPITMKDGHYIKKGYNAELDELRLLLTDTKSVLSNIELNERERTGIRTLKIAYNKVFGYYIEVSNSFKDQVPEEYIRKQTLVNGERFITQELKELEEKILVAGSKQIIIEEQIFKELREYISKQVYRIQDTAQAIAKLDYYTCLATVAEEMDYVRPTITNNGLIAIKNGRHPIVEQLLDSKNKFISNDTFLDNDNNKIMIITGPNMAGKSTYIRQVAIIVLLAQIGSFVPASSAEISIVDGIYTRVGASDDLASGQSTFMVEMNEVAQILKNATKNSLIILDEVGRGTSTFDGMSIAKAIIEYIADSKKLGAKTLFATHYHELTELENTLNCVKNYNTAVKKCGDDITFLRRIVKGSVDDSYGIEVSKLAGIPEQIIARAKEILQELKSKEINIDYCEKHFNEDNQQVSLLNESAVEEALRELDIESMTPIEALNKLYEFKSMI